MARQIYLPHMGVTKLYLPRRGEGLGIFSSPTLSTPYRGGGGCSVLRVAVSGMFFCGLECGLRFGPSQIAVYDAVCVSKKIYWTAVSMIILHGLRISRIILYGLRFH